MVEGELFFTKRKCAMMCQTIGSAKRVSDSETAKIVLFFSIVEGFAFVTTFISTCFRYWLTPRQSKFVENSDR